jgi:biopolymer transport protein ExbD
MKASTAPESSGRQARPGRLPWRADGRLRHVSGTQPQVQIQITPLMDVLLVLLVLGLLAWSGSQASRHATERATALSRSIPEDRQGLSLPLRNGTEVARSFTPDEDGVWIGLGLQGRLTWREAPVTRDILTRQLRTALEQNPHAEVWLAVDQAMPYADLLPWLDWLQTQHVQRLTLMSRSQPPASLAGKP